MNEALPSSRLRAAWVDRAGMWTSGLCVVHCLLTPILLSFSPVIAHLLPSEERVHRLLAVTIALLGAGALLNGFRAHRRVRVLLLMGAGVLLIGCAALWGDALPTHWMEVAVTFLGSALMISAHRLNHTFCKECACASCPAGSA